MFELGFVFKFQAYDVFQVVIVSPADNLLGFYPADGEIPEVSLYHSSGWCSPTTVEHIFQLVFEIINTIWLLPGGNPSGQD
ncbi:hypothetical protein RB213_012202 [Colletotrichum asianum]